MVMRIHITTPLWRGTRTGTARPAFGRGRYHVTLDGERRDLLFTADEMVREDGGRL